MPLSAQCERGAFVPHSMLEESSCRSSRMSWCRSAWKIFKRPQFRRLTVSSNNVAALSALLQFREHQLGDLSECFKNSRSSHGHSLQDRLAFFLQLFG